MRLVIKIILVYRLQRYIIAWNEHFDFEICLLNKANCRLLSFPLVIYSFA